jgi:hypothetical protein
VALSINSYDLGLKVRNPPAFKSLVAFFGGNPEELLYAFDQVQLEAKALRTGVPKSMPEVLLTTGSRGAGDFVFVQYTGSDRARFGYQHGEEAPVLGPEVAFPTGPFDLAVTYGGPVEDRTIRVAINGTVVFVHRATFYFTSAKGIGVGRDQIGSPMHLEPFSGTLEVKRLGLGLEP